MREIPKELTAKLLGLVVGKEVNEIRFIACNRDSLIPESILVFVTNDEVPFLNMDTLTVLMKKWCYNQHCPIFSTSGVYGVAYVVGKEDKKYKSDTEYEAVLKVTHKVATEKGYIK